MSDIVVTQDQLDEFAEDMEDAWYDWDDGYDAWSDLWDIEDDEEDDDQDQDKYSDYEPDEEDEEFSLDWIYNSDEKSADETYRSLMMQCSIKGMDRRETRYLETELYQNIALADNDPIAMAKSLKW